MEDAQAIELHLEEQEKSNAFFAVHDGHAGKCLLLLCSGLSHTHTSQVVRSELGDSREKAYTNGWQRQSPTTTSTAVSR